MTKEEAYEYVKLNRIYQVIENKGFREKRIKPAEELINQIYNDFENRICKNCKFYDNDIKLCKCKSNSKMLGFTLTEIDEDFGCNRFKQKDKK